VKQGTMTPLTFMAVHAHPDDEVIGTGGTFARYAVEGVQTVLVTCTLGEEGEIVVPEWDTPENHARLDVIRRQELQEAVDILQISHLEVLPYRDSGMIGLPSNEHPECFNKADPYEATGRLVALVRAYRPHVLVTYNEEGGYGHPDHLMAHQITVAAFDAAGDPAQYPQAGKPWTPQKLYLIASRRSLWLRAWQTMRERGLTTKTPLDDPEFDPQRFVDDPRPATAIDITPFLAQKLAALRVHRTQIKPDWPYLAIPDDVRLELMAKEHFVLLRSRVDASADEDDLFSGIRDAR
jgi:N-acetyl-1-D-myo-inositol-2-amino-2-deoxy-alpha-D-glucopyranoside deacetylase